MEDAFLHLQHTSITEQTVHSNSLSALYLKTGLCTLGHDLGVLALQESNNGPLVSEDLTS